MVDQEGKNGQWENPKRLIQEHNSVGQTEIESAGEEGRAGKVYGRDRNRADRSEGRKGLGHVNGGRGVGGILRKVLDLTSDTLGEKPRPQWDEWAVSLS